MDDGIEKFISTRLTRTVLGLKKGQNVMNDWVYKD
jgi:hypothetical protein